MVTVNLWPNLLCSLEASRLTSKPLRLIEFEKSGFITGRATERPTQEAEYDTLVSAYNAEKREHDRLVTHANTKNNLLQKILEKKVAYSKTICSIITSILPRALKQEIQLLENALDELDPEGYITTIGFMTNRPEEYMAKVKAAVNPFAICSSVLQCTNK